LFHIASQGNFSLWSLSPISSLAISHSTYDPHFSLQLSAIAASGNSDVSFVASFAGLYNVLLTLGFTTEYDIFLFVFSLIFLAIAFSCLAVLHATLVIFFMLVLISRARSRSLTVEINSLWVSLQELRLSYHLGAFFGISSILWSLHIMFVALPV